MEDRITPGLYLELGDIDPAQFKRRRARELLGHRGVDRVSTREIAAAGVPGFTEITAYENVADTDPRFMRFYEFDSEDPEATFQTMAEVLRTRLGGYPTPEFRKWADWSAAGARIIYCNTFRLLGASARVAV